LIGPALQKLQEKISPAESDLRTLAAERDQIETDLRVHRNNLAVLAERIENHPIYASIRTRQSELFLQAAEIAKASWNVPLPEVHKLISKLADVAETEAKLISSRVSEIRAAGLPDVAPRLPNLISHMSPSFIDRAQLYAAHSTANELIRELFADAARIKRAAR
jgi:hypothetical protein